MSRSKKDQPGGHPWPGYGKECSEVKKCFRRKRRLEGKRLLEDAPPEKSTNGHITW